MREYTHIAGAVLFFLIFAYILNLNNVIFGIIFAGWISVFPDIIDKLIGKHKGIGHSILWVFPLILVAFCNFFIGVALLTGFLSHLFFDIFTTNGCPLLYPISHTNFVSLRRLNRVRTTTNQEKGVFIFIIFLIVPLFLFTSGISTNLNLSEHHNLEVNTGDGGGNSFNHYGNSAGSKNTVYINLNLNSKGNKNISVEKINDNITNVIVKDLEAGG